MYNFSEIISRETGGISKKIGLDYPIASDLVFFNQTTTVIDEKRNSLFHMLKTYRGELPLQNNFGCKFKDIVFEIQNEEYITGILKDDIKSQLKLWHPDTILADFILTYTNNDNKLTIELKFVISWVTDYEIKYELIFNI